MEKITRADLAARALEAWSRQYGDKDHSKQAITKALEKLGTSPKPSQVDDVIGNDSWTILSSCGECGNRPNDFIVVVGEEPDWESSTAYLCGSCIQQLVRFAE